MLLLRNNDEQHNNPIAISQTASAGKWVDMSELQVHHSMIPEQWTWLLCSVSFIPATKLPLQQLTQVIGIQASVF